MAYTPDPTDPTQPTDAVIAETAQAEFRALKAYLQSLLSTIATGVNVGGLKFKDSILRNGEFNIWQRNVTFALAANGFTADGWQRFITGAGRTTDSRLAGFDSFSPFTYQSQVTTASGALGVGDIYTLNQPVPGRNIAKLAWGTAVAKPISISFIGSFSVAGLHAIALRNGALNRSYVATFTVLPAQVSVPSLYSINNIPGDVAGAWTTDTTVGLNFDFVYAAGSNFNTPALDSWQAGNFVGHSSLVNEMVTVGNIIKLGRVKLADENVASPFVPKTFADDLWECMEFYEKSYSYAAVPATAATLASSRRLFVNYTIVSTYAGVLCVVYQRRKIFTPTTLTIYSVQTGTAARVWDALNNADCVATITQASEVSYHVAGTMGVAQASCDLYHQFVAETGY